MQNSTASETVPRPLTPHERAIFDLLLSGDFPGAAEFRVQAEHVQVVAACGCGCDSYDVGLANPGVPRADLPNGPIPQELTVTDPDGTDYGSIIMLAHNGVLSYLDFHTWDDRPHVPTDDDIADCSLVETHPRHRRHAARGHCHSDRRRRRQTRLRRLTPIEYEAIMTTQVAPAA